jgi:hypothetical protein
VRYILAFIVLGFSSSCFANTYSNCNVDSVLTHEALPNLVIVTTSCVAPDAATTGANCSGVINPKAFVFDISSATGKAHFASALTALTSGATIWASTYGACLASLPDTLLLYSLRLNRT